MSTRRLLGVWFVLAIAMSANGVLRELVLRRAIGASQADIVSAAIGAIIILAITQFFFRSLRDRSLADLARVSAALLILTVAFEFIVGRYIDGKSWDDLIADYAIWRGRLWPVLLLIVALTPFVWGRWVPRRIDSAH